MLGWQQQRNEKLAELTIGTHILAYLIITVIFIVSDPSRDHSYNFTSPVLMGILIPIAVFIVLDCHFMQDHKGRRVLTVWNFAKHAVLFAMITAVFASYRHDELWLFSALYLLPVVLACITLGRWWGLAFAAAATASISILSLSAANAAGGRPVEAVLVIGAVFFLLAWFFGGILEVEKATTAQLLAMANEDSLTGLGNYRFFRDQLTLALERSSKEQEPLSLILLDIDSFKLYNDTCGHTQGDLLLQELAALLRMHTPPQAMLTRHSSDEFAVILPRTGLQQADKTAGQLNRVVAEHPLPPQINHLFDRLTVSVGIANYPYHAQNAQELLEAADEALYSSKTTGGNRVQIYHAILERLCRTAEDSDRELTNSLRTLMTVVNAKDRYTYGHSDRVSYYAKMVGQRVGVSPQELRLLEFGAFLHDIGKLEIPREVLNMKGPLSSAEWEMIRKHPVWGAEIIKPIGMLQPIVPMVLHHHENYDGSGYPDGLKGKNIPLFARILRVVDSFDAITTNRPYHTLLSREDALKEIGRYRGLHYDPMIVDLFCKCISEHDTARSVMPEFTPSVFINQH